MVLGYNINLKVLPSAEPRPGLGYLPKAQGEMAAEVRLLYVAMTRAIEMLVLTGDRRSAFVDRLKGALAKVG